MQLKEFFIKAAVVTVAAIIVIWYGTYSLEKATANFVNQEIAGVLNINKNIDNLRARDSRRIRLLGMTTFNPEVYYKVSLVKERENNIDGAIEEMELGLGLVRMWSADEKLKETFQARLDSLKAKR
ncbi:MAG TPA: hypothetical protein VM123_07285 [archaeon]|nr:hypothetical protein [archaeon]